MDKDKRSAITAALDAIIYQAENKQGGEFTPEQEAAIATLEAQYKAIGSKPQGTGTVVPRAEGLIKPYSFDGTTPQQRQQGEFWKDTKTGELIPILRRGQSFSSLYQNDPRMANIEPHAVGRMIKAMVSGDYSGVGDIQAAMGGSTNTGGGYLVPNPLAAETIDLMRAESVFNRLPVKYVPMTSDSLTIARVATDPTITDKAENIAFSETSIGLDAIGLYAHTCGAMIVASRELAADAPNFSQLVEQVLARKLAQQMDNWGLRGTGGSQPTGVTALSGVTVTDASVGSIAATRYDEIIAAIGDVENLDATPNAIVTHPDTTEIYRKLKTGDGTNSAAIYQEPPAVVSALPWINSTQAVSGELYVADWSTVLVGVRQSILIEMSTQAGDAFAKHQVAVKATCRIAFNAEHANLIAVLRGITA